MSTVYWMRGAPWVSAGVAATLKGVWGVDLCLFRDSGIQSFFVNVGAALTRAAAIFKEDLNLWRTERPAWATNRPTAAATDAALTHSLVTRVGVAILEHGGR